MRLESDRIGIANANLHRMALRYAVIGTPKIHPSDLPAAKFA